MANEKAIVGGIVGARVGKEGIPAELTRGIWEWPRSSTWMESLGTALSQTWPIPSASRAPRVNPDYCGPDKHHRSGDRALSWFSSTRPTLVLMLDKAGKRD